MEDSRIDCKADVAQLVEQPIRNRQVSGSTPLVGSSIFISNIYFYFPVILDFSLSGRHYVW